MSVMVFELRGLWSVRNIINWPFTKTRCSVAGSFKRSIKFTYSHFLIFSTNRQDTGGMPSDTTAVAALEGSEPRRRGTPEDIIEEEPPDPESVVSTGRLGHVRVGVPEM